MSVQQQPVSPSVGEHLIKRPEVVRLRDGSSVTIRPAIAQDEAALRSFLLGLCLTARRLRFFSAGADVASAAHDMTVAPGRFGLVAHDEMGTLVGHALLARLDETRGEVAVEVADRLHDRGLGTMLLERLAAVAESQGVRRLIAEVLPENRAMLDVFRDGFGADIRWERGVDTVEFPPASWRLVRERLNGQPGEAADLVDRHSTALGGSCSV